MYKKLGVASSIPFSRVQVQLSSLPCSIEEEEVEYFLFFIRPSYYYGTQRQHQQLYTGYLALSFEKIQRCNTIPPLSRPSK